MNKRKLALRPRPEKSRPGVTIKLSAALYGAAKERAERSHRSVPKQVEYWTDLGRVLDEVGVSKDELMVAATALRVRSAALPSRASALLQGLVRFFDAPPRDAQAELASLIQAGSGPVYGTSPAHPGKVIERRPDGTESIGRFDGGKFVAESTLDAEPRYAQLRR
jgi:hypothetical protein